MADFQRESLSVTSPLSQMAGGAKKSKKGSKRGSKKGSKKMTGGAKKSSKKGSKKGSRKQSRGMNPFMEKMLSVKKELKSKHGSLKDGPAMSKLASIHIKDDSVDKLLKMPLSDLENKLEKINKEIAEKRASKKASQ